MGIFQKSNKRDPITTPNLLLRQVESIDLPFLIKLRTDPKVRAHLGGALSIQDATTKGIELVGKENHFAIADKTTGKLIGLCSLGTYKTGETDISYELMPEFWGKGLGKEAASEVIKWGFNNLSLDHIIGVTQESNIKSRKLLESLGFTEVEKYVEFNEPQVKYILHKS